MRDRLSSAPKTILLGSCITLAVLAVTACGGGAGESGAPAVAAEEPSAPAVTEAPADASSMDASEAQVDASPSQEAGIAEEEVVETSAPSEEPVVEPRVTALHDGVPVDGKTVGFEEATVEIIDFSDFQ